MRPSRRNSVLLFAMLFAALAVIPNVSNLQLKKVEARAQNTRASDVKQNEKQARPPHVPSGGAPANDNCANAINITSCPFTDSRFTAGATDEAGEPSPCGAIGTTVWYTFANTTSNAIDVAMDTCTGTDYDTVIAVYQVNGAACDFANFVNVACDDDGCGIIGGGSALSFSADPGVTYKIQVGGFLGDSGTFTLNLDCTEVTCEDIVINGALGSGDPNFEGTQFSGNQQGRLFRDGIASTCAVPKACAIFTAVGARAFDAYEIPNESGEDVCVTVTYSTQANCGGANDGVGVNAYLDVFDPNNICTGYLGDSGVTLLAGGQISFSVVVPANSTLILVAYSVATGVTGCTYSINVHGNLCAGFDFCVQGDTSSVRFIQFNSENGNFRYRDCQKGILLEGQGTVTLTLCKLRLVKPGQVDVNVNICTRRGTAKIKVGISNVNITDSNVDDNTCECPGDD